MSTNEIKSKALEPYATRNEVKEISYRLTQIHPDAEKLGQTTMIAIAQAAILLGANPHPAAGEIWAWENYRGEKIISLGVAYYRRKAATKDKVNWLQEPRVMTEDEAANEGLNDGDIGAICVGYLGSQLKDLVHLGMPIDVAETRVARTGTARVLADEMFYSDNATNRKKGRVGKPLMPPHGRTWAWLAKKRAEVDWYRMQSMVDTTLTDAISERAVDAVRMLDGMRPLDGKPDPSVTIEQLTEAEAELFDENKDNLKTAQILNDVAKGRSGKKWRHWNYDQCKALIRGISLNYDIEPDALVKAFKGSDGTAPDIERRYLEITR